MEQLFSNVIALEVEKATAPHSSTLAWKIPWMKEPGRLQSMGSRRVGHDWATSLSLFTFMHWRRKWQPAPVLLPGESQGRGAWWAAVCGVAQSQTRLKRRSSSSSSSAKFTILSAYWVVMLLRNVSLPCLNIHINMLYSYKHWKLIWI